MANPNLTYSPSNPLAGIMQGFAQSQLDQHRKELDDDLKYRETIIAQLDAIVANPEKWGTKSVQDAFQAKLFLSSVPPTKPLPPEWKPGKEGGIPAAMESLVRPGLQKQLMKSGPAQPAEPPMPPEPEMPGMPGMPGSDAPISAADGGFPPPPVSAPPEAPSAPAAAGMAPPPPTAGMPPIEGGAQIGPNQISAAPAVPGMPPPTSGAPPMSLEQFGIPQGGDPLAEQSVPGMPPPASAVPAAPAAAEGYVPPEYGMLGAEELARRKAHLAGLENQIMGPDGQPMDKRLLTTERADKDRAARLLKMGMDESGNPLPPERMPPEIRLKAQHQRIQEQIWEAKVNLSAAHNDAQRQYWQDQIRVRQQNADTLATRAGFEMSLMGGGMLGMGGALGDDTEAEDGENGEGSAQPTSPVDSLASQVLTNQIQFSEVPAKLKPSVSVKIAAQNDTIVPKAMREKLNQFNSAQGAMDLIYSRLEDYKSAKGIKDTAVALGNLRAAITGTTRLIGRAAGERGVFTNEDKADFEKLLSPGMLLTMIDSDILLSRMASAEELFTNVQQREFEGFYSKLASRERGPGATKKTVPQELTPPPTSKNLGAATVAPPPVKAIPKDKRVAGVTRGVLNGAVHIWDGEGWEPVEK